MYAFGSGVLFGVNSAANSTPVRFGGIQDVSIDFSFTVKELHGQSQFPLAEARGTGKITGKAKMATINGRTFNDLFFGQTLTAGSSVLASVDEGPSAIPGTPFQVTVANAASFQTDLGVFNVTTGLWMQKVASAPATGQYSVAAGVYTFAAADTGNSVKISYTYTSATLGKQIAISNQLLGTTPLFQAVFTSNYLSKAVTFTLNRCTASKLNFATKLEDFTIPEFDFSAFADDSGNIGNMSFAE